MNAVLIATLGAEPQVIALAAQLLQQQGEPLVTVLVVHTDPTRPPVTQALPALYTMFADQPAWPPLHAQLVPIADVLTPDQFTAYTDALLISNGIRGARILATGVRRPNAVKQIVTYSRLLRLF